MKRDNESVSKERSDSEARPNYTPGPWSAYTYEDGRISIIRYDYVTKAGSHATVITDMVKTGHEEANARLIAAAPMLYALVRSWRNSGDPSLEFYEKKIDETIAQIEGREG